VHSIQHCSDACYPPLIFNTQYCHFITITSIRPTETCSGYCKTASFHCFKEFFKLLFLLVEFLESCLKSFCYHISFQFLLYCFINSFISEFHSFLIICSCFFWSIKGCATVLPMRYIYSGTWLLS
jgi:hypothetical protein